MRLLKRTDCFSRWRLPDWTEWSVDIVKIDDNKVPDGKIVRNATIDNTKIVDVLGDGHRVD
jgi:hypothetical protein